jgi:hypothetical protein
MLKPAWQLCRRHTAKIWPPHPGQYARRSSHKPAMGHALAWASMSRWCFRDAGQSPMSASFAEVRHACSYSGLTRPALGCAVRVTHIVRFQFQVRSPRDTRQAAEIWTLPPWPLRCQGPKITDQKVFIPLLPSPRVFCSTVTNR